MIEVECCPACANDYMTGVNCSRCGRWVASFAKKCVCGKIPHAGIDRRSRSRIRLVRSTVEGT